VVNNCRRASKSPVILLPEHIFLPFFRYSGSCEKSGFHKMLKRGENRRDGSCPGRRRKIFLIISREIIFL
ncbi:MAG: hypothetical protein WC379_17125, partial [Methanoregula sp.]